MITEDQLEQLCLDWFREGGYEYANGYDIAHDWECSVSLSGGKSDIKPPGNYSNPS